VGLAGKEGTTGSVAGEMLRVGGEEAMPERERPSRRFGFATSLTGRVEGLGRDWVVSLRASSSLSSKLSVCGRLRVAM
jgi:hypothetical protein